ncbi:hypothetical protein Tco_0715313 [Tanacetum coccineum]
MINHIIWAYLHDLSSMPFVEGFLPIRYLGFPLISSRLLYQDCKVLVEILESWIIDSRNKFLSLAGRLQLVRWTELCPIRGMLTMDTWHTRFPNLVLIPVPNLHDAIDDVVVWRGMRGEGCTLFSFFKVFPCGFFLERFIKEANSSGLTAPILLMLDGEEFAFVIGFILLVYVDLAF